MRNPRTSILLVTVSLAALAACDRAPTTAPLTPIDGAHAATGIAPGAAVAIPFSITQTGDDPCTEVEDPAEHQVTAAGTVYMHTLPNGDVVLRREYTITSTSGYEGHGKIVEVANGSIYRGHFNDMVFHPDGRQFRAHAVHVIDLKTDPPTTRVLKISGLTCVRS